MYLKHSRIQNDLIVLDMYRALSGTYTVKSSTIQGLKAGSKDNKVRIITANACKAFMDGTPFRLDNTEVKVSDGLVTLSLHGNIIAMREPDVQSIDVTTQGWNTMTTRERLNGLPNVRVHNSGSVLFLNGKEWDGNWQTVEVSNG